MNEPVQTPTKRSSHIVWIPLAVFAAFLALVFNGLYRPSSKDIESAMVGKPLPEFALAAAVEDRPGLSRGDFTAGDARLLNIFASWCIPCAIEAPQLEALRRHGIGIDGITIRDRPEDVAQFLRQYGNPFARIGADNVSAVQLALGSSGVPESFVIDGEGIIRYQHIGVIRPEDLPVIMDKLQEASK